MGSDKGDEARQTAAEQRADEERRQAEAVQKSAQSVKDQMLSQGKMTRQQMIEAGIPTAEESQRLERAKGKASTPGEALLTSYGPIAQALAKRVQERTDQPGLDYNVQSDAFAEGVTQPLTRALKARGILPQPGAGGGLGIQQYMKGAEPALAELRSNQINTDLTRAMQYGEEARGENQFWANIENTLAEAIRQRQYQSGMTGAEAEYNAAMSGIPYEYSGAKEKAAGFNEAQAINQQEVEARYGRKDEASTQLGTTAALVALGAISGGILLPAAFPAVAATAAAPAVAGISTGAGALAGGAMGATAGLSGGGGSSDYSTLLALAKRNQTTSAATDTPAARQLGQRQYGLTNPYK